MKVSAVVFDMDGLMVDTEPLYHSAWKQAASEAGYEITDALYATFVGRPTPVCEALLHDALGPSFPLGQFQKRWPELWKLQIQNDGIPVKPGLIELLDFVESERLPMAVATSSEEEYTILTLSTAGLLDRFTVMITGDRVERGKPEPDIYLEAARRLKVSPSECVAFEDSEAGIRAVQKAGMKGILV